PTPPEDFTEIAAAVPGNIELDLARAGILPANLEFGENIYRLKPYETCQFWYRRSFRIDEVAGLAQAVLVLEGVDTLATIWVNGHRLGTLANMLVGHELPVGHALRDGENEIVVAIDSAVLWAQGRPVDAGSWAMENNWESLAVRKPPHAYGWDIMPRALLGGIWRDIRIEDRP